MEIDWSLDDNKGVIYRDRQPTVADYDEAIADLQNARKAIETGDESKGCAVCGDSGHGVRTCHHNPLMAARSWVVECGKWRCYHCDYVALTHDQAVEHFGKHDGIDAACVTAAPMTPAPQGDL